MNPIIASVRKALKAQASEEVRQSSQNFFKEGIVCHGVKSALVEKIGKQQFATVRERSKREIYALCEELWKGGYIEECMIACHWSYHVRKQYESADIKRFESWVASYVTNWATCDTLCNHSVGTLVEMFPEQIESLKKWAQSKNRWQRRAAAVALIIPARHGKFLADIFAIADLLLLDNDDLVQKGYGWMLKAASEAHTKEVHAYVMRHKMVMPRTALRYAIEKMPDALKKSAMIKPATIS